MSARELDWGIDPIGRGRYAVQEDAVLAEEAEQREEGEAEDGALLALDALEELDAGASRGGRRRRSW
jgi:hypothetical protein